MADMNDLAMFMDGLANVIDNYASAKAAEAALSIITDLIRSTPADTGAAISNWLVSIDVPDYRVIAAYAPSPKGHVVKGVWVHKVDPFVTAQANAPQALAAALAVLRQKTPGHSIFITNNVEYIIELNSGTSLQAPIGFVDRAILIANKIVGRARII